MAYTIDQIKVFAYNNAEQMDFTPQEKNLFCEIGYCYEWWRSHPADKKDCIERMEKYIEWFEWAKMREIKKTGGGSGG